MCGRYALAGDWSDFTEEFSLDEVPGLVPRYNIAPTAQPGFEAPIVVAGATLVPARFWYIPSFWNKSLKELPTSFNARSETVMDKKFFVGAQRCLVPLSGWREFPGPSGKKRAFNLHKKRPFFALAGIWSEWRSKPTEPKIASFSILTCEPSEQVKPLHHRMPMVVERDDYERWLDPRGPWTSLLEDVMQSSQNTPLEVYECSIYGNSTKNEGPECIAPVAFQQSLF